MKRNFAYWLRWLAVLPGALLASALSTVLLHLILYLTLRNFVDPVPELPERILTPFVIAAVFIYAGARIAPEYKKPTAISLFGLWLFLAGGFIFLTFSNSSWLSEKLHFQAGGIAPIMTIVGAFVGLYAAHKMELNKKDNGKASYE